MGCVKFLSLLKQVQDASFFLRGRVVDPWMSTQSQGDLQDILLGGILLGLLILGPACCLMFYGCSIIYINKRLMNFGEVQQGVIHERKISKEYNADGDDLELWRYSWKYVYEDNKGDEQTIFGSEKDPRADKYKVGDTIELIVDPHNKYLTKPTPGDPEEEGCLSSLKNLVLCGYICLCIGLLVCLSVILPFIVIGRYALAGVAVFGGFFCVLPLCIYRNRRVRQSVLEESCGC